MRQQISWTCYLCFADFQCSYATEKKVNPSHGLKHSFKINNYIMKLQDQFQ
jgi:hypothetical protein